MATSTATTSAAANDHQVYNDKIANLQYAEPNVNIFLRPIAAPAALGLAGFAGATFITASWMARWWGDSASPGTFFPFVLFFGGLAQFVAAYKGFDARDTLTTVIHGLVGSFYLAFGLLFFDFTGAGASAVSFDSHNPEIASWFVVLTFFSYSAAFASFSRDLTTTAIWGFFAIGSTIGCSLYASDATGVRSGMKAAAYFWLISAFLAWWRVTVFLVEESFGAKGTTETFFPIFRTEREKTSPLLVPGLGEPGVKRGMPGVL